MQATQTPLTSDELRRNYSKKITILILILISAE